MFSSKKQDSGTSSSSSSSPSSPSPSPQQTHTHQTPFSVAASKDTPDQENPTEETPDQKNPTEETETPNQETETPEEEESSDDEEEEESSEEEYDPNEELILFPDTSNGDEEYDDITFLKYIRLYEKQEQSLPLPISINEREPTRYDMSDLLLFVEKSCNARYADFSRCRFRNKIMKMRNKYRNIVQQKGENPTVQDFVKSLGKLHFEVLKKSLK